MSGEQEDVSSHPLVIVRRRRNTDEHRHGGVWKIAYTDFMTAMMAFFLVMWLINAADRKTIVQVAAYFNPMRLTDRYAEPKGLQDLIESETRSDKKSNTKKGFEKEAQEKVKLEAEHPSKEKVGEATDEAAKKISTAAGGKSSEAQKEQALFDNPDGVLNQLANEANASQPSTSESPVDGNLSDPFDRLNRRTGKAQPLPKPLMPSTPTAESQYETSKQPPLATPDHARKSAQTNPAEAANTGNQPPQTDHASQTSKPALSRSEIEKKKKQPPAAASAKAEEPAKPSPAPAKTEEDEKQEAKEAEAKKEAKAKKLSADISSAISNISRDLPNVEVKATPEGLLVSLTDDANFGMFEVGSAKPRPELVVTMSKIGGVLQQVAGKIVVRGHTDSRAYKSGVYDNWRLSSARAQMAYYMLVRGGLDKSRVVAIEGRADRDPKIPSDPEAAQNRRIEILIKEDKSKEAKQ